MLLLPVVTTLLLILIHAAVAEAERWTPPLREIAVVREFDFDAHTPFVRGARRGVRLGGSPGEVVFAPCSGRVTFAGRHPRLGLGLALRCGRLVATEFGLERPLPRRGATIAAGMRVGVLGRRGELHLGARRADEPWGYRNPLGLFAETPGTWSPFAPPPRRLRRPREAPPAGRAPHAVEPGLRVVPLLAWAGLGLAGAGAGLGVTLQRRVRRARRRLAPHASGRP